MWFIEAEFCTEGEVVLYPPLGLFDVFILWSLKPCHRKSQHYNIFRIEYGEFNSSKAKHEFCDRTIRESEKGPREQILVLYVSVQLSL